MKQERKGRVGEKEEKRKKVRQIRKGKEGRGIKWKSAMTVPVRISVPCPASFLIRSLSVPPSSMSIRVPEPSESSVDRSRPSLFHVRNWKLTDSPSIWGVPGSSK